MSLFNRYNWRPRSAWYIRLFVYLLALCISLVILIVLLVGVTELIRAIFGFGPHLSNMYHITKISH